MGNKNYFGVDVTLNLLNIELNQLSKFINELGTSFVSSPQFPCKNWHMFYASLVSIFIAS
jgi:hypothetical protein